MKRLTCQTPAHHGHDLGRLHPPVSPSCLAPHRHCPLQHRRSDKAEPKQTSAKQKQRHHKRKDTHRRKQLLLELLLCITSSCDHEVISAAERVASAANTMTKRNRRSTY